MSLINKKTKKEDCHTEKKDVNDSAVNPGNTTSPQKASAFSIGFVEQIELIVIAFAAIVLIFSFLFRTCQVSGPSMENTLLNKETVIASNLFYTPERNDIIVFHQTGVKNEPIVKRVIGLPGETVNIEYTYDTMKVTIIDQNGNATVLDEPYIKYEGAPIYYDSSTYVEEGTVFVLGDNRNNSADSRIGWIGLVDTRRILGKVIFRVTPFSRMGTVN